MLIPHRSPRRFGIGGAGNLSTQSIKSSGSEEQWLINTANDTEKQRLSQDSGYSGTTFNSTTSRHCGIGGVGNVVPKQAFVSSAISSVKLTSENRNIAGMGIAYRRFGIGGAGNVILRK